MAQSKEIYNAHVVINRVHKAEIGFCPIVKVPIRTQIDLKEPTIEDLSSNHA